MLFYFPEARDVFETLSEKSLGWSWHSDNATPKDLEEALKDSPRFLAILCHGEGDYVNPFLGHLKLRGGRVTLRDIFTSPSMASQVFLGACETDLVPFHGEALDEHLSVATAFLTKGATTMVSTMYEVAIDDIKDVLLRARNNFSFIEDLMLWQRDLIGNWHDGCEADHVTLSDSLAFRVFLNPTKTEEEVPNDKARA